MTATTTTIYSDQAQTTDYILIKGIRTRLGIRTTDFDSFVIKELLDNALDFIDTNSKKFVELDQTPYVHLIISEEKDKTTGKKVSKIVVRNSNAGLKVFSNEQIERIFNFERYYSSKRNRYQISRGALGGAFKDILGIPYALAFEDIESTANYEDWKYPMQINIPNDRSIDVRIEITDKIKKTIKSKIDIKNIRKGQRKDHDDDEYTEIIVYIPKQLDYGAIHWLFYDYALINTHIDFKLETPQHPEEDYKATQKIKEWKNNQSIYYYSLNEFKDLIRGFEEKSNSLNVYENLIHTDFREGKTLPKGEHLRILTFGDLKPDDKKIEDLYNKLKGNLKSIKYQSTSLQALEVPFDIKQNLRQEALRDRFDDVFGVDGFAYKRLNGYFGPDISNIESPFIMEIIVANAPEYKKHLLLSESVNFSPSIYGDLFDEER